MCPEHDSKTGAENVTIMQALDEQSGKKQKLKKVKSKKVPRVDHSAALMSQTPSVVARKQAAASAYPGGPGAASGDLLPRASSSSQMCSVSHFYIIAVHLACNCNNDLTHGKEAKRDVLVDS